MGAVLGKAMKNVTNWDEAMSAATFVNTLLLWLTEDKKDLWYSL